MMSLNNKLQEFQAANVGVEQEALEDPDEDKDKIEEQKSHCRGRRTRTKAKKFDEEIYDLEEHSEDSKDSEEVTKKEEFR